MLLTGAGVATARAGQEAQGERGRPAVLQELHERLAVDGLAGNADKDRDAIKDRLTEIKDFDGITGKMTFTPGGNPTKCAVIVKISDKGEFEFYKSACP